MARIIKKYPNRRLYDTERSRYITVADVRKLVIQRVDFKVVDANSDEDLTRGTLLQIIMDQESGGEEPLFTAEILSKMIRFYDDSVQGVFTSYLEKSLNLFIEQQTGLQEQIQNMLANNPPVDALTDLAKRNLDLWRDMQDQFLTAAGMKRGVDRAKDDKDSEK